MTEKKENQNFNEEELLKKVERAAAKGAGRNHIIQFILACLPVLLAIALYAYYVLPKINAVNAGFEQLVHFDSDADTHDTVLEDQSIFGYTAADFENAILGDGSKLKKLEVYTQEVSDVSTITDTGFVNWSIFTKTKLITYNGTVVYTVDLSTLKKSDIQFNEEEKIITLKIPHAGQEEINIPEDQIQFGDTSGGLLAFGDIKLTPEQAAQVQAGAREKMQAKLDEDHVLDTADRFAVLSVWELYSPIIKGVAKDYSLQVEFR
ncbi:MAG: DUF4230 domain-containing protein [Solobacterium sp.]|nr:DUF4230 domain-containing protein [Solobacterium sp.]